MTNDPTIDIVDNSDLDLTGVPLRDPVIDKQRIRSTITNLYWEQVNSKKTADGKAKQLVIELATEEPAISTDGKAINPGHRTKVKIFASPTAVPGQKGGLTQDVINKKVGFFQVAALGLTEPDRFGPPERYIGRSVYAVYEAEAGNDGALYQRVNRWEKV